MKNLILHALPLHHTLQRTWSNTRIKTPMHWFSHMFSPYHGYLDHSHSCPIPKHHWYPWVSMSCLGGSLANAVDLPPIFPAEKAEDLPWFSAPKTLQPFRQDSKMSWNTSSSPAVRLYTGYNWGTSMERPSNWRTSGRAGSAHVPKIWSRSFSMNFVAGNDHNQPWSICDFDTGLPQEESWPLGR